MIATVLIVISLLVVGALVVFGIAFWASTKSSTIQNFIAFGFAAASSYALGIVLNMWVLATANAIPPADVVWPSSMWIAVTFACIVAAFRTHGSPYVFAAPFVTNGALAFFFAPSIREVTFVAVPLLMAAAGTFLYQQSRVMRTMRIGDLPTGDQIRPVWLWINVWIGLNIKLALGALLAYFFGWLFDSLAVGLILFALWAIVSAPSAWETAKAAREVLRELQNPNL